MVVYGVQAGVWCTGWCLVYRCIGWCMGSRWCMVYRLVYGVQAQGRIQDFRQGGVVNE